mmetsp:Transcript_16307/g.39851  ORF Transcript_16307/g.39851 Transcript_16307/m.39851 type:complete len:203 (-) Transcript_16307:261-869(-)
MKPLPALRMMWHCTGPVLGPGFIRNTRLSLMSTLTGLGRPMVRFAAPPLASASARSLARAFSAATSRGCLPSLGSYSADSPCASSPRSSARMPSDCSFSWPLAGRVPPPAPPPALPAPPPPPTDRGAPSSFMAGVCGRDDPPAAPRMPARLGGGIFTVSFCTIIPLSICRSFRFCAASCRCICIFCAAASCEALGPTPAPAP